MAIRKEFDLFANVRPVRTILPGGRYEDIDLVLIRENTEGLYVGVEHFIGMEGDPKAAAESVMITTRFGSERIARFAFDYAVANGRGKVTLAHKANILKHTQGLFLEVGRRTRSGTPTGSPSRTGSSTRPPCSWCSIPPLRRAGHGEHVRGHP